MGTLGKAAGVAGAFVAAHPVVIEWLLQAARSCIYTTAAPPALAQALLASLDVIEGEEGAQRRLHLARLIALLRERVGRLVAAHPQRGWALAESRTAIQPLVVGSNDTALRLSALLEAQGLWVPAIRPPTVPAGTARLRITLSASHTEHDLLRLVDVLAHAMEVLQ
jgi:8-amino-7-oxononanoate synthase